MIKKKTKNRTLNSNIKNTDSGVNECDFRAFTGVELRDYSKRHRVGSDGVKTDNTDCNKVSEFQVFIFY